MAAPAEEAAAAMLAVYVCVCVCVSRLQARERENAVSINRDGKCTDQIEHQERTHVNASAQLVSINMCRDGARVS